MFFVLTGYTVTLIGPCGCESMTLNASGENEVATLAQVLARSGIDFSVKKVQSPSLPLPGEELPDFLASESES